MADTIYLKDFIEGLNQIEDKENKKKYIGSFIRRKYVSYGVKVDSCHRIVSSSYYVDGEENTKFLHINSPAAFMLFCLEIVSQYTSIVIDYSNVINSYDLLREDNVIETIFSFIPEYELHEYETVLEMVKDDVIKNEYEPHAYLRGLIDRFAKISGISLDGIQKYLEENMKEFQS